MRKAHNKLLLTDIQKRLKIDGRSYAFVIHVGLLPVMWQDVSLFITTEHSFAMFVVSNYSQSALLYIADSTCSLRRDGNEIPL